LAEVRRRPKNALMDYTRGALMGVTTDVLGYPVDTLSMAMRPFGYNVDQPIGGSDWLANKLTSPTGSPSEMAGRITTGMLTPGPDEMLRLAGMIPKNTLSRIIPKETAKGLPYKAAIPDSSEFATAVANTPGAQMTPDGLVMRLSRKQGPHVEGEQAIRTGVFYLPEGDKRMKYYGGKAGYGGSEQFSGETIIKRPLFVKGATGGKAPENAYDQIVGKGAYEQMRREVLRALPYSGGMQGKIDAIKPVLEKYGGDPSMASVIVAASNGGNTLTYAIQEHIVAHAVRKAGYDSVLGYSNGQDGPFLSEVFDVRELTYPSDVLSPQIHDAFTGGQ
jgi:hypothetical protein